MSQPALLAAICCLGFFVLAVSAQDCDKSQCKGPIRFYEELKCKPMYAKEGDCCAVSYDCSHLQARSADKCYANGHEYSIGERLKNEDSSGPCDVGCTCVKGYNDVATFICAIVDCFRPPIKVGCHFKHELHSCCGIKEVCPEPDEKILTCEFNGTTYRDGELFYPNENQACLCSKDYKGENIEPFCRQIACGTEIKRSLEIRENCPPVFYESQSPAKSCSFAYRCQNENDTVIRSTKTADEKSNSKEVSGMSADNMKCKFGNMTMDIGDELNQATDYSSVCVKCQCEVPPMPTCQRLPDNECDVTKHPKFGA